MFSSFGYTYSYGIWHNVNIPVLETLTRVNHSFTKIVDDRFCIYYQLKNYFPDRKSVV